MLLGEGTGSVAAVTGELWQATRPSLNTGATGLKRNSNEAN